MTNPETQLVPSAETPVEIHVSFDEPSGSSWPFRTVLNLGQLGVQVEAGQAPRPTIEEEEAAMTEDRTAMANQRFDPANSAWNRLYSSYAARSQSTSRPIAARLRDGVIEYLKSNVPQHEINGKNYTFKGGQSGLSVTESTDDPRGSVTGVADAKYYQVSGSAVWGE